MMEILMQGLCYKILRRIVTGFMNGKRRQCQLTRSHIAACPDRYLPAQYLQPHLKSRLLRNCLREVKYLKLLAMINIPKIFITNAQE